MNNGKLNTKFMKYIVINKKNNFAITIFTLLIGNDCNLVLSASLKNSFLAVKTAKTVNKVEIINKNNEKWLEVAFWMTFSLVNIALNK